MIFQVFQNAKYRLLFSILCLSVALSSSFSPSLMASNNSLLGENEKNTLKRTRAVNNPSNNHNAEIELPLEGEHPLKNQKTEQTSGASINATFAPMDAIEENIWMPNEFITGFFFNLPISSIRSGRCVSKQLQRILTSDDFCTYWGSHFSPSTPKALSMTPQEFILYWSTPFFEIMENILEIKGMSADGSTIVGFVDDKVTNMPNAVQWKNGKIEELPGLEIEVFPGLKMRKNKTPSGISSDGTTIVGFVYDSSGLDEFIKAVQWKNGEIEELPGLDGRYSTAANISADGSTIVGFADDKVTNMPNAVHWKNGEIEILQKNDETEVRPSRDGWGVTRAYINANGSTIVSDAAYNNVTNKTMVVQWKNGEIEELPSLNNIEHTGVCSISAEGSTVVGLAIDSITRKFKAVQWKNGKIEELPSLKDFDEAKVCSISADGSTIVGYSGSMIKSTATLWTKNDVFSIQSLLEESGVTLEENHLASADLVSANGLLVMGRCDHPWSNRYFKAILPSKYSQ